MRIAAHLHPQHATYSQIRDAALKAEDLGVDVIYNWDHFFPLYGEPNGEHYEAWTMLASWAEVTNSVQIGCLVTCNSYRNPQLLADMARTVDCISDGRLILGIGSGWFERDYDEYGYEFGTAGGRLDVLEDALPEIKDRLGQLNPPAPGPLPILIGGSGEKKTLRYTARHANVWHSFWDTKDPEKFAHKSSILAKWCEAEGTDDAKIERSLGVDWDQVDDVPAMLDTLSGLRVDEITLGSGGPDYNVGPLAELLAWRDSING